MDNDFFANKKFNILIAATGSVAALKIPLLIEKLILTNRYNIKLIHTERALHFFNLNDVRSTVEVKSDKDEWEMWKDRGDPVLHIELGRWADLMVLAPLDANTLAKISNGICDNLITCTVRAWDHKKPLLFCPAMNTRMYQHPLTRQQIDTLISWSHIEVPVVSKTLICGDVGEGAMAEVDTIVMQISTIACDL